MFVCEPRNRDATIQGIICYTIVNWRCQNTTLRPLRDKEHSNRISTHHYIFARYPLEYVTKIVYRIVRPSQILNVPPYKQPNRLLAAALLVSFSGNSENALYIFYFEMQNNVREIEHDFSACTPFKVDIH